MRILFSMAYPGYLRYYDSTIRALAERGHVVELYFETMEKQEEGLEAIAEMGLNVSVGGTLPVRETPWRTTCKGLRRVTNYVRYLDPRFADASYLRRRSAGKLPPEWQFLTRWDTLPTPIARSLVHLTLWLEQAVPPSGEFRAFLEERSPDVVVATPLVAGATRGIDLVQSANELGIPTAAAIASWDHLTTKGMLRRPTTRVILWNDIQRREAMRLHRIPGDRIVVTGAQPFDKWFHRRPELDAEAFRSRVGLESDRPYILFLGSTASISSPDAEHEFVRAWISALRRSEADPVRTASVLIRPHPYNTEGWLNADLSEFEHVAVWPRDGANPVDEADRNDYFHSLFHAEAAVGINTSAMIEAAIVSTPVLTITAAEFTETQRGTLHFHYLLPENGGFVRVAQSLDEHVEQLASVLVAPDQVRAQLDSFVSSFIRPHGIEQACTELVVDSIETLPACAPVRRRPTAFTRRAGSFGLRLWNRRTRKAAAVRRRQPALGRAFFRRGVRVALRTARNPGREGKRLARRATAGRTSHPVTVESDRKAPENDRAA